MYGLRLLGRRQIRPGCGSWPQRLSLPQTLSQAKAQTKSYATNASHPSTSTASAPAAAGRPSFAPRPMLDVRRIRANPEQFRQDCLRRNYPQQAAYPHEIVRLHEAWLAVQRAAKGLRTEMKQLQQHMAAAARQTKGTVPTSSAAPVAEPPVPADSAPGVETTRARAQLLKRELQGLEAEEAALQARIEALALAIPNLTGPATPSGPDPVVLRYLGQPHPSYAVTVGACASDTVDEASPSDAVSTSEATRGPRRVSPEEYHRRYPSHVELGTRSEYGRALLSFAPAAAGWGWYYLLDEAAELEQALVQYALAVARRHGWRQAAPPSIVYRHIATACGFQPRDAHGEQQIYDLATPDSAAATTDDSPRYSLAGTAEIPMAALHAQSTLSAADLPLRHVAVSRSYRAEAGARGADTRGLYRVHEFTKVELFAWTLPDAETAAVGQADASSSSSSSSSSGTATAVFDEMVAIQTEILSGLGLYGRVLAMPPAELGASAIRKIDMEAWFPSRRRAQDQDAEAGRDAGWGEVTSASICSDYQTRRLQTRLFDAGPGQPGPRFPWTVNGTALAVPRVLAALCEQGWRAEEQRILVPDVLRPWMGARAYIERR